MENTEYFYVLINKCTKYNFVFKIQNSNNFNLFFKF